MVVELLETILNKIRSTTFIRDLKIKMSRRLLCEKVNTISYWKNRSLYVAKFPATSLERGQKMMRDNKEISALGDLNPLILYVSSQNFRYILSRDLSRKNNENEQF